MNETMMICKVGDGLGVCNMDGEKCEGARPHAKICFCTETCRNSIKSPCVPYVPAIPPTTLSSASDLSAGDKFAEGMTEIFKSKYDEVRKAGEGHWKANIVAQEFLQRMFFDNVWKLATAQETV